MLKIKRMMLFPLRCKKFWKRKFVRRRILSLGDPICCPAVTFDLNNVERPIFKDGFRSCEDLGNMGKFIKIERRIYLY